MQNWVTREEPEDCSQLRGFISDMGLQAVRWLDGSRKQGFPAFVVTQIRLLSVNYCENKTIHENTNNANTKRKYMWLNCRSTLKIKPPTFLPYSSKQPALLGRNHFFFGQLR